MLIQLNIKQFGIIEKSTIEFKNGLTVLSGETGAGKSMILAAISQLSGQRTSTSYIRHGEDKATVEGVFDLPNNKKLISILENLEINFEEDILILRRDIYNTGKSICRVNNVIVNLSTLREISSFLLDIHEQHDNQMLLLEKNHIFLIDSYGKNEINPILEKYKIKYEEYKLINKKLEELKNKESEVLQRLDFLKYQYEEINKLNLILDEDVKLIEERDYLLNYEKINNLTYSILESINGDFGVLTGLYSIKSDLEKLVKYNSKFENVKEEINNLYYILEDLKYDISKFNDNIDYDEARLDEVEFRLSQIKTLEKKYSKNLNELIELKDILEEEINELENYEENYEEYTKKQKLVNDELLKLALELTQVRKKIANKLEQNIQEELKFLCMEKSTIKIEFDKKDFSSLGNDDIKILISSNLGEPLKSLVKVASGGELSRIMLALKIIFSSSINVTSIIFDEIDTGVSGRVSQRMAEKMYQLAIKSQVLCISHLPQTTALADCNLLINKTIKEDRTISTVRELNFEEKVSELARMISGTETTELSKKHAIELLEISNNIKKDIRGNYK